jgi:hypothetical protein
MTAESSRENPADLDVFVVAECGECDTGLAPGNRFIPAETDQANGLPEVPRKPAHGQARACRDDQQPILTSSPVGPLTPPIPIVLLTQERRDPNERSE